MIHRDQVRLRKMVFNDLDNMLCWLNDTNVQEFYEGSPTSMEELEVKYGPRIQGKHYVTPCIVEYENEPIGYIQFYQLRKSDLEKYRYSDDEEIFGIDQFIGDPKMWGKGIGTNMITLLTEYLKANLGVQRIALEVKKTNGRAQACYKKCGFKMIRSVGEYEVMEWNIEVRDI